MKQEPLHVVTLGVDLDRAGRAPGELIGSVWRDFGRLEAAAAEEPWLRVTIVQASWVDERRSFAGLDCHFVREDEPMLRFGGRLVQGRPRRLYTRVRDLAPDLVHFSGLSFPRQLQALRQALVRVPVVAQDHGLKIPGPWRRWYYRWGLEQIDAALFCAREQADPLKLIGVIPRDLPIFEVIETSTPFGPGDQRAARAETGLDGDPCLFWLGNLDANKDPLMVLEAVSLAATALPALRLHMCFRYGALLAAVEERIARDPALRGRVKLLGEIPYPGTERYLRAADFLLQASHQEGGGSGLIEALACGTTPLVTDIPAFRRITGDGIFGALVARGDSAGMAREIVRWSGRDRTELRRAARRHFDDALSFRAVGAQLRAAYRQARALR